jgi:hypothetical protein
VRTCEVIEDGDRCDGKHYGRGMCQKHYYRWKRNGDALIVKRMREHRDDEKWCPQCREWLSKDQFVKEKRAVDGLRPQCRSCQRHERYGITRERWDLMLIEQKSMCAICGCDEPAAGWYVDHDHNCCIERDRTCGECVRALLCSKCNFGLGQFDDDPDRLLAAAMYLLKHTTDTEVTQ